MTNGELFVKITNKKLTVFWLDSLKLNIPKGIRTKNKLEFKKYSSYGSFKWATEQFWNRISRPKYNIIIQPSVFWNNNYYVHLAVLRENYIGIGSNYWIKMTKNIKVLDWCEHVRIP